MRENRAAVRHQAAAPLAAALWTRFPGAAKEKLELKLAWSSATEDIVLEIEDGDNPPLILKDIRVSYPVTRPVFRNSGSDEIHLYYGNRKAMAEECLPWAADLVYRYDDVDPVYEN